MKKTWGVILLSLVIAIYPAALVSAHIEASDGRISAFLHISPDDKPQPGKLNTIHVYFNDQDFRFTTEGCFCKIKVSQGKQTLYNGDLKPVGQRIGEVKVWLPADNFSYPVVVSGVPKTGGFFQPFKLNYDIDVGTPTAMVTSPDDRTKEYLIIGGLATATSLAAVVIVRNRSKIRRAKEDI